MTGYNEDSAMPDLPQGTDETGSSNVRPMVGAKEAAALPSPSTPAGTVALAWWDSMKYFWKRSASGGFHLAPLEDYVADVLDRGDHYISLAANAFQDPKSGDFDLANAELKSARAIIETREALFQDGTEAQAFIRAYLQRAIIARKISGATAVSAEHRVVNELNKPDGNVEALKDDANGFYASDVEKRERWALKACYYEYLASQLADGEVIPTDGKQFAELMAKRIGRSLYDDAVERGNRIKRPDAGATPSGKKMSREEMLALTA